MGLDLYAGTLSRYHTGQWETEAQQFGREAGIPIEIVYSGSPPKRLSKYTAPLRVSLWRRRLQRKFSHLIKKGLNWPETETLPYFTRKPDHDGRLALVLAAAYAESPQLDLPRDLPESEETDPAYLAVSDRYANSMISVLECHMFLPSEENFLVAGSDVVGIRRFVTSTANLDLALRLVNKAHWQADQVRIDTWAERGAFSGKTMVLKDGEFQVHGEEASAKPFEHCAQFGFAVYSKALAFSREHNVPILTDE